MLSSESESLDELLEEDETSLTLASFRTWSKCNLRSILETELTRKKNILF